MNSIQVVSATVVMLLAGTLTASLFATEQERSEELHPPQHVLIRDQPIDVERFGHAAPFFGDIDNDGLSDLLVGQFDEGKLRVYPNAGNAVAPTFESYDYLRAGAQDASIPFG